jgi:hypothetical protein
MTALLNHIAGFVGPDGSEKLDGMRFIDWPTFENQSAVHEGLQAMTSLAMQSGERLMGILGDEETAALCRDTAVKLAQHRPATSGRKSPAALLSLAGLQPASEVAHELQRNGPSDFSTFLGFYVLGALAKAGETGVALDFIRQYWGGMMDLGATTFWEDFDLAWTRNAGRIDQPVPAGKKDVHGDYGAHCYTGFRHSLSHGWAGGPTAFLSRHVLGIEPAAPGFSGVRVNPNLGDLEWAEGTYPTRHGVIELRHEKKPDDFVSTTLTLPKGIRRVR